MNDVIQIGMNEFIRINYIPIIFIAIVALLFFRNIMKSYNNDIIIENMEGNDLAKENENLKLLAKYLTLVIRKSEAQKELYTIETGKRQVYNSPSLVQLNRQITVFKEKIRSNPSALKYFDENLNITL